MASGTEARRSAMAAALVVVLLVEVPWTVLAQAPAGGSAQPAPAATAKPEELEQIVAPIALYPDPLLAQALMASTYPLEVVTAARWLRENSSLKGAQLDDALKKQTWDDSVKSLVSFPQVLNMMNDKLDWTQKLGDAFLQDQKAVMDAVQRLRARAEAEGNLKSTKEQTVKTEQVSAAPAAPPPASPPPPAAPPAQSTTTVITIQPTDPQVVYVPTYNPTVVYGAWPYPAYPPYYYYPPGYVAATAAISFGVGLAVGGALWGGCNWGHGDVDVNVNKYNNFTKNVNNTNLQNRISSKSGSGQWQHNPEHRKGVQYRDQATQQRYGRGDGGAQSREQFRGRAEQGRQSLDRGAGDQSRQAGAGGQGRAGQGDRPGGGAGPGDQRGAGGGAGPGDQRGAGGGQRAGAGSSGAGGARGGGGDAFQGMGSGGQTRDYSNRGHSSLKQASGGGGARTGAARSGGGGGGGRGGGGGGRRR